MPKWLAMTMKTSPTAQKGADEKRFSVEQIVKSLEGVGADMAQIVKLNSNENSLMSEFLSVLKDVPERMFSVAISPSALPIRMGKFTQARIDSKGHLILTSEDGLLEVIDLTKERNRELMIAVVGEIVPRFEDFVRQLEQEKLQRLKAAQEVQPPEPVPEPELVPEVVPVALPEPEPEVVPGEIPINLPEVEPEIVPEVPVESPAPEPEVTEEPPVLAPDLTPNLDDVVAETLEYLEMLGNEVFDQSPVSVYFDDWLVNLRQVMLAFESNEAVKVDDLFTDECEQIYNNIEEELGNRLLKEAEIEASAKSVTEKKYILREMDDEYNAQTQNLQVRGKSALDFMIKSVQRLEEEIAKTEQIKTNNFIKKIALKQKRYTLGEKLKSAKHRLSVAMDRAAASKEKLKGTDSASGDQTVALGVDENSSKEDLVGTIERLEKELVEAKKIKVSVLQPLKKLAKEQKISEITEKLDTAKQLLEMATQTSEVEKRRIQEEYEKKKQATMNNLQNLEKEIATKRVDDSIAVRKEAIQALSNAVKTLIQRNAGATAE